ncbi:uncharacterized protein A4U43_C05F35570 [Asparagus officinalis]|uniref:Uncharacterized protein n=1 Tax=Asparagus officinalis TaxID=4686 RepID=A0A5P1EYS8_ASPOF|nr:uncharacterized protein A4U43_C05F35570 [Asparagus officinalis]
MGSKRKKKKKTASKGRPRAEGSVQEIFALGDEVAQAVPRQVEAVRGVKVEGDSPHPVPEHEAGDIHVVEPTRSGKPIGVGAEGGAPTKLGEDLRSSRRTGKEPVIDESVAEVQEPVVEEHEDEDEHAHTWIDIPTVKSRIR